MGKLGIFRKQREAKEATLTRPHVDIMKLATVFHRQFSHERRVILEWAEAKLDTVNRCQAPCPLSYAIQLDTAQVWRTTIGEQEKDIRFDAQTSQDGKLVIGRAKSRQA